ncbi:DNA methyltransferase [Mycolicibacterium fortuitum]|uniref:DNA-methyltransferase n=1 Tax=Mycolicibacterium fortuitum TaxID=1766 RepID=UPI0007EC2431|nr:DNA methyltransferase [Mycolicibacterium fortuitum]OBA94644.1 DNA methyltransferase [Mycolicibacterium fortuitum]
MKPYYQDESVTLYHGDCLEITDWLPSDVLVMDPPYGIRVDSRHGKTGGGSTHRVADIAGDHSTEVRDTALAMWGNKPFVAFGTWKQPRPNHIDYRLIWHKANGGTGLTRCVVMTNDEEIYLSGAGFKMTSPGLMSVITTSEKRSVEVAKIGHPTPKPIGLMEKLIDRCPPGVIADPFAGSGATLVAAVNQGRKAMGVELEERYCELIAKRLQNQTMTLDFGEGA